MRIRMFSYKYVRINVCIPVLYNYIGICRYMLCKPFQYQKTRCISILYANCRDRRHFSRCRIVLKSFTITVQECCHVKSIFLSFKIYSNLVKLQLWTQVITYARKRIQNEQYLKFRKLQETLYHLAVSLKFLREPRTN